jgi:hypothetical protein
MSNIQEVQSYRTPDGQIFTSKKEAMAHIHKEAYRGRAEAYADDRKLEKASRTRAINIILDYCAFEESQDDAA